MRKWMPAMAFMLLSGWLVVDGHAGLTARETLRKADEARGNLDGIRWELNIVSLDNGRESKRSLVLKSRGYDFVATMGAPPKVKGQKLLMIDHNMWFGKPGLRKPVPISPRQKMLGVASNGDIAATNYSNDYQPVSESDDLVGGEACLLFDLRSVSKKTTYDRIRYWVSKTRLVGVKAEFFTVSGKLFKTARFEYRNRVEIEGIQRPFISKMVISDALVSDNVTTLEFEKPLLMEIPDSAFDLNLLMSR